MCARFFDSRETSKSNKLDAIEVLYRNRNIQGVCMTFFTKSFLRAVTSLWLVVCLFITPAFAAGPYDGIYLWSPGYFLSVHQNAGTIIGSIYWVYTGNNVRVGNRTISEADTFDLMNGQIVGSNAAISGTRFYRACTLSYDLTFNSDFTLTVRLSGVGNSPGVAVVDVDCAAKFTPADSVWTIPRLF
jgi:hypothetical protein